MALRLILADGTEMELSPVERAWYELVIEWVAQGATPYLDDLMYALFEAGILRSALLADQGFLRKDGRAFAR